jgi:hypothetical protein
MLDPTLGGMYGAARDEYVRKSFDR